MSTGADFDLLRTVIEELAEIPVFWFDEMPEMAAAFVELTETANAQTGHDDVRRDQGKTLIAGQRVMTVQCKIVGGDGVRASVIADRIRLGLSQDGPNIRLESGNMAINDWGDPILIPYQLDQRIVSAMTMDLFVSYAANSDPYDEDWIEVVDPPDLTISK